MKDQRSFTVAGTSFYKGQTTYRFATGSARTRTNVLLRNGHTDVRLMDLPYPMKKDEAIVYLNSQENMHAVMPKTGRNSNITPEMEEEVRIQQIKNTEEHKKKVEEVAKQDDEFLSKMVQGLDDE